MPHLYFTVTNDIIYDQRMQRICTSLANSGYTITLVGRQQAHSKLINNQQFTQKRLNCWFNSGMLFYLEYNIRLFLFLASKHMDGICAIDLDTILPCYLISRLKRIPRIYDAHELFCEMKEIVSRPPVYKIWKQIEKLTVPHFRHGYTVNHLIADEFYRLYGVNYEVIRSLPVLNTQAEFPPKKRFILYQGAVNEGRCFETLIPAMKNLDAELVICGEGNFFSEAKQIAKLSGVTDKIQFRGMIRPDELSLITREAYIGITLFEKAAQSNYWSLANRFFDYIHAGVPQLCVDYPLYREINNQYDIAYLIPEPTEKYIVDSINELLHNQILWQKLHHNCLKVAAVLNWQEEEKKLITFYKNIFG